MESILRIMFWGRPKRFWERHAPTVFLSDMNMKPWLGKTDDTHLESANVTRE